MSTNPTPWTQKRVNELPHIIAGPIVRKVTDQEVTIWVAVKTIDVITLKVYAPSGTTSLMTSNAVAPKRIGENLYITCVTAIGGTGTLQQNTVYGYDLEFNSGTVKGLNDTGILGGIGIDKITFASSQEVYTSGNVKLPSFLIPPAQINDLNVYHGSCRKPHGGGADALTILHDTLEASQQAGATTTRPQMLFLTGDQIYADDVDTGVLHQILQYHEDDADGNSLIGWKEELPTMAGQPEIYELENRHKIILEELDTPRAILEDSHNHMIRMTEFMLMYCMVWSPELWTDVLPTYENMHGDRDKERTIRYTASSGHTATVIRDTSHYEKFGVTDSRTELFRKGLPKVRKALANVPTYMVFDDHDVTNNWFLNENWCERILEGIDQDGVVQVNKAKVGRRWVQNAMSSIAICQAWGNDYNQFNGSNQPGTEVANAVDALGGLQNAANGLTADQHWVKIETNVLPYINRSGTVNRLDHHANTFNWHWFLECQEYEIIGLDTRSMRSFRQGRQEASGLMSDEAMDLQVKNLLPKNKELTIVLSGTPIMGVPSVELGIGVLKWFGKPIEDLDFESWNVDDHARMAIIAKLLTRRNSTVSNHRVLCLAGDVHYGFTNLMDYKANSSYHEDEANVSLKMAQFCSSSLKNFTTNAEKGLSSTIGQHTRDFDALTFNLVLPNKNDVQDFVWKETASGNVEYVAQNVGGSVQFPQFPVTVGPRLKKYSINDILSAYSVHADHSLDPPEKYKLNPAQDWWQSLKFEVVKPVYSSAVGVTGALLDELCSLGKAHQDLTTKENISGGSWLVGYPNIGNIDFNWTAGLKEITHNINWINEKGKEDYDAGNPVDYVLTQHTVDLT